MTNFLNKDIKMGERIVKSDRVYLWDNLKIILILFVVIHHTYHPYRVILEQRWLNVLYLLIMSYTMSTFTIISGYWFRPRPLDALIKKFLFPCLLIVFLCTGLHSFSPVDYIREYTPWAFWIMWYLWALFIYYLITPYLLRINLNVLLVASFLFTLAIGTFQFIYRTPFSIVRVIGFFPFFILGIKLRQSGKIEEWKSNIKIVMSARVVFVVTLLLYLMLFFYDSSLVTYSFVRYYTGIIGIAIRTFNYVVVTILSISLIVSMPNKQYWFTKYGSRSMTPYILHPLLLYTFSWNLAIPIMDKWYGYVFYMLVIPALSMMTVHSKIDGFVKKLTS